MNELLFAFYGDDFTGSTDALDALCRAGVETVLFLTPPDSDDIDELDDTQAIGLAGMSRSMTPEEMDESLRLALDSLSSLQTPLVHYKICSTFDSSPKIGSIGKGIDIGADVFDSPTVPLLPGAPPLGRYVIFGNMFAEYDGDVYRLDRHPTMSTHPVTPMDESDLLKHLSEQTDRESGLVDILRLRDAPREAFRTAASSADVVFFDVLQRSDLTTVGRVLWNEFTAETPDPADPTFVVGSSGVEYAVAQHWEERGLVSGDAAFDDLRSVNEAVVMSGSASPVTDRQVERALENGFEGVRIRTEDLVRPSEREQEKERVVARATESLEDGYSVVIFTARGPDDPAIERTKDAASESPDAPADVTKHIGEIQGDMLAEIVEQNHPSRLCIAGGDTCGYVTPKLGIDALEMRYPLAPGSPVCQPVESDSAPSVDQIALKGGQLGGPEYFVKIRDGTER